MLTNRLRLWIIYALIFVAIVGAAIGVAAKFEQKRIELQMTKQENVVSEQAREIAGLKEDKQRQDLALTALQASRDADSTVLAGLSREMQRLGLQHTSAMDKISHLEKTNEKVRAYLDSPVPPDGCVLDNSCSGRTRAPGNDPAETQ